jgi:amino acid transporter
MNTILSTFWILIIVCIFLGAFFSLLKDKKLNLDEKSLDKQGFFWFAVIAPIVLFLVFGVFIWKDYIPRLDKKGLDTFFEISKFPLSILALSPVLGVIVSNIHRTIQTNAQIDRTEIQIKKSEEQIRLTSIKNNMDAFYAHNKYILEGLQDIKVHNYFNPMKDYYILKDILDEIDLNKYSIDEDIVINSSRRLLSDIYMKNYELKNKFEPQLNKNFLKESHNQIEKINNFLNCLDFEFSITKNSHYGIKMFTNKKKEEWEDVFMKLSFWVQRIKITYHIEKFLSLDYIIDFLKSEECDIVFNIDNNDYISVHDYFKSLIEFVIFLNVINQTLYSISTIINHVSYLTQNDQVYDIYNEFETILIFIDNKKLIEIIYNFNDVIVDFLKIPRQFKK